MGQFIINVLAAIQVVIMVFVGVLSFIRLAGEVGLLPKYQEGPWYQHGWLGGAAIASLIALKPKMIFGWLASKD